jgi:hypothetical protein
LAESIRVILRNPRNVTPLRKGVEAVLNHMAETSEEKSESNEAA